MDHILVVEVFKTGVQNETAAFLLLQELHVQFPEIKFNFALDDCDKILRAEGESILPFKIIKLLKAKGFECEVLE